MLLILLEGSISKSASRFPQTRHKYTQYEAENLHGTRVLFQIHGHRLEISTGSLLVHDRGELVEHGVLDALVLSRR